jgi:2,3-bisphosphoglycerate-independent phosphoglycerate mutase
MRCIFLVLDGLGDKGHACFEGKTPLKVASTPNLDHLARLGMNGLYHAHLQGTALSSELAHFLMFGYDTSEFPGRGVIEAVGEGISVGEGEVAVLARIFSVSRKDDVLVVEKESPDLDRETCQILQKEIKAFETNGVEIEFVPTKGIEGIVILRGDVSASVTDSNPIYEGRPLMEVLPHEGISDGQRAVRTCKALNSYLMWCYRTLSGHPLNKERSRKGLVPINAVGTQRAGKRNRLVPFRKKWGMRALSISSGSIYHGLCSLLEIETCKVKDSGNAAEDLLARLRRAKESADFEFIHVHTEAPDEAAHT